MIGQKGKLLTGQPKVYITTDGNYTPYEWAEMLMDKLISVSKSAPEPIRSEMFNVKQQMQDVAVGYFTRCIEMERSRSNRGRIP